MRIPHRILFPVAGAIALVIALLVFLFMQLEGTRALLVDGLSISPFGNTGAAIGNHLIADPDTADESLINMREGDLAALRGQWADAVASYEEAVDAGGGNEALKKLAQAKLQRRDVRGTKDVIDTLKRQGGSEGDILLLESSLYMRTGEITKASQLLEGVEDSPQRSYGLGLLAIIAGDHEAAKQHLLEVHAGWDAELRLKARSLLAAYEEYALFPSSPTIHLMTLLGRALAQVQECELALPLLSDVTHQQDDYRDAWMVQGFCELSTERFQEALSSLEQAYRIDPEKAEIQYFLARAYLSLEDHGNALTFLQYALRNGFQPEEEVRQLIAEEAITIGNAALALEQYDALTLMPNATVDFYNLYVTAAITAGQKQEALLKAEDAVERWPEDGHAYELLGWVQAENDMKEEARASLQKALEIDPSRRSAEEKLKKL